jgi:hypothetical protein
MSLREKMEATPIVGALDGPVSCSFDHPAWPDKVYVRQLKGADLRLYERLLLSIQPELAIAGAAINTVDAWEIRPFLVCRCLVDESNTRLFDNDDQKWIDENLPGKAIVELSDAAIKFNGLGASAVADEQKNSESGTPSDS